MSISSKLIDLNNARASITQVLNSMNMGVTKLHPIEDFSNLVRYANLPVSKVDNFLSMSSLPANITLTRSSQATYFDKTGKLLIASNNTPRFDYNLDLSVGNWVRRGLLIEKASVNLFQNSETFENINPATMPSVQYSKTAAMLSDGFKEYTIKYKDSNGNIVSQKTLDYLAFSGDVSPLTLSMWGKSLSDGGNKTSLKIRAMTSSQKGLFTSTYRPLSYTESIAGADVRRYVSFMTSAGGGDISILCKYIQLEANSYPTSYIPTTNSNGSRSADAIMYNNATAITGTVMYVYQRLSDNTIVTDFVDYNNQIPTVTSPNFSDGWLRLTVTYARVLTYAEKIFAKMGISLQYTHNFITNQTIPSWLTFGRLSAGSYWNSSGLLSDAGVDVPRFEYSYVGNTWTPQGLLLEKQKTNNIPRQYTFENMSTANASVSVLSDTLGSLAFKRVTGARLDNDLDRVLENSSGFTNVTGTDLYLSSVVRKGTSNRGSFGFSLADSANNTIYPKLRMGFENADELAGTGLYVATATTKSNLGNNVWKYGIKIDTTLRADVAIMRPYLGPYISAAGQYIDLLVWQSETKYPSSFIYSNSFGVITRSQDNLQANVTEYTGTVMMKYKRQDTEIIETKFFDITNQSNPILTNNLDVGVIDIEVHLFPKILTNQEKLDATI